MTEEDRKKKLEIQDLWIDIGAKDKAEAQRLVRVGDPITYAESFEIVRGQVAASRAFDDKAGSFAVGEVLRLLAGKTFDGSRLRCLDRPGRGGAARRAAPAPTALTEGRRCCGCVPRHRPSDMDRRRVGEIKLRRRPGHRARGPNISPVVERMLIEAAEADGIPYQLRRRRAAPERMRTPSS